MIQSSLFVVLLSFSFAWGYKPTNQLPVECRSCNLEECNAVSDCVAGVVKDVCGCCDVCAKSEFELCHHPDVPHPKLGGYFGRCGEDLECKVRTDLAEWKDPEAICYCIYQDPVCGSDATNYDNICRLRAASVVSRTKITVAKNGACSAFPVIVTRPENIKNVTGSNIAILCEARGYPIPDIEWTWTRVDGQVFTLPSDDLHISINVRGGPEKWQVTGWLQIIDLKKDHEGDYTCTAINEAGFEKAIARVNVISKNEKKRN